MAASWSDCISKKSSFRSVFTYNQQQRTISRLDCNMQWKVEFIWWLMTTSSVARPRRSSNAFSKAKLAPEKGHDHWWCNAHLIHYSSLNPSKTITSEKYAQQIDEMHPKLQHLQLTLVNRIGPILLHDNPYLLIAQPTLQKLNELVYEVLPHPPNPPSL